MAIVTGTMLDFKLFSLFPEGGRIVFTPSEPALRESGFLVTRRIVVYPDAYGAWSQNLAATTGLGSSTLHYKVRFEWLESGAGYVGVDFPGWELRVPPSGGAFSDLVFPSGTNGIQFGLGPPPPGLSGTVYINLSDVSDAGARIYFL